MRGFVYSPPVNSDYRIVRSGRVLEVFVNKGLFLPLDKNTADAVTASRRRSMIKLRRTISANASGWYRDNGVAFLPLFMTLTFAGDIDVRSAKREVYLFFKRVNWGAFRSRSSVLKYSYVIERTKSGRPHFHVVLYNLPFIPNFKRQFEAWWRNGFVRINAVRDVRHLGAYVSKYMSKDFPSADLGRRVRLYANAQKLVRPVVYLGDDARWWFEYLGNFPSWYFKRGRLVNYSIHYLGSRGIPWSVDPPRGIP